MSNRHARISLALITALLIGVIAYSLPLSFATATAGNPDYTPAIQLPLPAQGTTNQLPNYSTYRSPNFRTPGQQTASVTLTVHVPASMFSFDFELVVQNRATGAVSAQPLRGVANKSDPSLVHATLQLPHGAYVIGLYESPLTAGIHPWGCSGTLTVQGPAALSLRPVPILHAGASSVIAGAVINMTGAQPAVVLALPVAATADYAESAVAATATGRFDVRVPGTGLFDLLAFQPGQGAVALTAVATMADKKVNANLTLPHWSAQDYTVLVQKGLAYTGNPLWTWGRAAGRQPLSLSIAPLQGAPPFRKIRLTVNQHAFSYKGTPWPKNYENLSAIYSVSNASGLLLSANLPGVPTGTNGNDALPLNRWPYYLAWNLNGAVNHATTAGLAAARSPFSAPVLAELPVSSAQAKTVHAREPRRPLQLQSLFMQTAKVGWALGGQSSSGRPLLFRTTDGGSRWVKIAGPDSAEAQTTVFSGPDAAWYAVRGGTAKHPWAIVYHTVDAGLHWWASRHLPLAPERSNNLDLLVSQPRGAVWLGAFAGGMNSMQFVALYRSTDNGMHWSGSANPLPVDGLLGFVTADIGYGLMIHDGGGVAAWLADKSPTSMKAPPLEPQFYGTRNGGMTWTARPLPVPKGYQNGLDYLLPIQWFGRTGMMPVTFYTGSLTSPYLAWGLYVTQDGGQTWKYDQAYRVNGNAASQNTVRVTFDIAAADQIYREITVTPGSSVTPKQRTTLWRATSPTGPWTLLSRMSGLPTPGGSLDMLSSGNGWAIGPDSIYVTRDGGRTWRIIHPTA